MSTKTEIVDQQATTTPIESKPMEEIVNMVRRDSQVDPQAYLEEAKVPHGGE
ncbi:MAG: hypothetical protein H6822_11640 [Planctomycetaceae bacterium]|nr:hypothetical protein [Planctomycetales bacterium]MCB9922828.1 hypothetical protein [Planctomycetaceae bacterium]